MNATVFDPARLDWGKGDGLLPAHRGKVFEELRQGIARLEVVEQCLKRHPRPTKHKRSAHDLGIAMIDRRLIGHASAPQTGYRA